MIIIGVREEIVNGQKVMVKVYASPLPPVSVSVRLKHGRVSSPGAQRGAFHCANEKGQIVPRPRKQVRA